MNGQNLINKFNDIIDEFKKKLKIKLTEIKISSLAEEISHFISDIAEPEKLVFLRTIKQIIKDNSESMVRLIEQDNQAEDKKGIYLAWELIRIIINNRILNVLNYEEEILNAKKSKRVPFFNEKSGKIDIDWVNKFAAQLPLEDRIVYLTEIKRKYDLLPDNEDEWTDGHKILLPRKKDSISSYLEDRITEIEIKLLIKEKDNKQVINEENIDESIRDIYSIIGPIRTSESKFIQFIKTGVGHLDFRLEDKNIGYAIYEAAYFLDIIFKNKISGISISFDNITFIGNTQYRKKQVTKRFIDIQQILKPYKAGDVDHRIKDEIKSKGEQIKNILRQNH